jgi:hypothetical protein
MTMLPPPLKIPTFAKRCCAASADRRADDRDRLGAASRQSEISATFTKIAKPTLRMFEPAN